MMIILYSSLTFILHGLMYPVGVIFGKERPGRVRGMSFGACSSLVFKKSTTRLTGMHHASSSAPSPQVEDKVMKMENELAALKE